jgi:integrase/recombinase XerC
MLSMHYPRLDGPARSRRCRQVSGGHLTAHYIGKLVAAALVHIQSAAPLRHPRLPRQRATYAPCKLCSATRLSATTERYTAVYDDEIRAAMMAALSD